MSNYYERPGCITAYAILLWLASSLFTLSTISLIGESSPAAICGGVVVLLLASIGYGLWQMRAWSWWLIVILQSFSFLGFGYGIVIQFIDPLLFGTGLWQPWVGVVINGGILFWFARNRALFISDDKKTTLIIVGVVLLVVIAPVIIIALLTLLGPQIGDVFSRIVDELGSIVIMQGGLL